MKMFRLGQFVRVNRYDPPVTDRNGKPVQPVGEHARVTYIDEAGLGRLVLLKSRVLIHDVVPEDCDPAGV